MHVCKKCLTCRLVAICGLKCGFKNKKTGSHWVLSLCAGQSALTDAPSLCCSAALDVSAQPPADYTAAADGYTGRMKTFDRQVFR